MLDHYTLQDAAHMFGVSTDAVKRLSRVHPGYEIMAVGANKIPRRLIRKTELHEWMRAVLEDEVLLYEVHKRAHAFDTDYVRMLVRDLPVTGTMRPVPRRFTHIHQMALKQLMTSASALEAAEPISIALRDVPGARGLYSNAKECIAKMIKSAEKASMEGKYDT